MPLPPLSHPSMRPDRQRALAAIEEFLRAIGQSEAHNPHVVGTPARVVTAWLDELVDGYQIDPRMLLTAESVAISREPTPAIVILHDIPVTTMCPHHLLPGLGTGTIVYQPTDRVTGLGTLVRLVHAYAHRLDLQENIGVAVAQDLVGALGARGAACRLILTHTCLAARGERVPDAKVETIAFAGTFEQPSDDRSLAIAALFGNSRPVSR